MAMVVSVIVTDKSAICAATVAIRALTKIVQQAHGSYSALACELEQPIRVQAVPKVWRQVQ